MLAANVYAIEVNVNGIPGDNTLITGDVTGEQYYRYGYLRYMGRYYSVVLCSQYPCSGTNEFEISLPFNMEGQEAELMVYDYTTYTYYDEIYDREVTRRRGWTYFPISFVTGCTDEDGNDEFAKSAAVGINGRKEDSCLTESVLMEGVCNELESEWEMHDCICEDGKCLAKFIPPTPVDIVQGTTTTIKLELADNIKAATLMWDPPSGSFVDSFFRSFSDFFSNRIFAKTGQAYYPYNTGISVGGKPDGMDVKVKVGIGGQLIELPDGGLLVSGTEIFTVYIQDTEGYDAGNIISFQYDPREGNLDLGTITVEKGHDNGHFWVGAEGFPGEATFYVTGTGRCDQLVECDGIGPCTRGAMVHSSRITGIGKTCIITGVRGTTIQNNKQIFPYEMNINGNSAEFTVEGLRKGIEYDYWIALEKDDGSYFDSALRSVVSVEGDDLCYSEVIIAWNRTGYEGNNWCEGADINRDGAVTVTDVSIFNLHDGEDECDWLSGWCGGADVNMDSVVNEEDSTIIISWLGHQCSALIPVFEFEVEGIHSLYGDYSNLVNDYNENDTFVLKTYGDGLSGKYSFYLMDYGFNSSFLSFIIPFDPDINGMKAEFDGTETELGFEGEIVCEKTCLVEDETGMLGQDECCYGFDISYADDLEIDDGWEFICTNCGDGTCDEHESWMSCYEDCYGQLECRNYEKRTEFGCLNVSPVTYGLDHYYEFENSYEDSITGASCIHDNTRFIEGGSGVALQFDEGCLTNLGSIGSERSIAFWAEVDEPEARNYLYSEDDIYLYAEAKKIYYSSGCGVHEIDKDIQDMDWHYIVITRDSTEEAVYIDNKRAYSGQACGYVGSGVQIASCNADGLNGSIDEVMIFNRALRPEEASELFYFFGGEEDYEELEEFEEMSFKLCRDACTDSFSVFKKDSPMRIKAENTQDALIEGLVELPDGTKETVAFTDGSAEYIPGQVGEHYFYVIASKEGYKTVIMPESFIVLEELPVIIGDFDPLPFSVQENLVLWMDGSEDKSYYRKHGALNGGARVTEYGIKGKGLEFDGDGDFVSIPDAPELENPEWTVCLWAYPRSLDDAYIIDSGMEEDVGGLAMVIKDGKWRADAWDGETSVDPSDFNYWDTGSDVSLNEWTHVAITSTGLDVKAGDQLLSSKITIYVNGKEATHARFAGTRFAVGNPWPKKIGRSEGYDWAPGYLEPYYFEGYIDEVMAFNRALTAEEVWGIYNLR